MAFTYPITRFAYHKPTQVLSAEASSLGLGAGRWPTLIQVEGKTGTYTFSLQRQEIQGEELVAMYYTCPRLPQTVTLLND